MGLRLPLISRQRRRQTAIALIERSSLFDRDWYLANYPDVQRSGVDPILHYLDFGWKEGRDPGPRFSAKAYLRANADVASLGVNPLLHYVEYGHSEGRGAPEHGSPAPSPVRPRQAFGPAAPVASFPVEPKAVTRWRRSGRSPGPDEQAFTLDGYFICDFPNRKVGKDFEAALARLARLSGTSEAGAGASGRPACRQHAELVDGWHLATNRLRTRWRPAGEDAIVIRAIQHVDGSPVLAGEGLVVAELDTVDAVLANRMFPVLFVFTNAAGSLIDTNTLVFPSLCRGGIHYAEAVALNGGKAASDGEPLDIQAMMEPLELDLLAIREGSRVPLVGAIEVDVSKADGTHPLFQRHVQDWLEQVMRVSVRAIDPGRGPAGSHLAEAVRVTADATRRQAVATLRLVSDMVPALSALLATPAAPGSSSSSSTSVILTNEDPAVPAVVLSLPRSHGRSQPNGLAPDFPSIEAAGRSATGNHGPAISAIRISGRRSLGDSEMLVPIAAPQLHIGSRREPVTWIVSQSSAHEQETLQCLEAIAAQSSSCPISIIFAGQPAPVADTLARRLFKGRVQFASGFECAARAVQTPFAGYIASNVILHDARTTAFLCSALEDAAVATASVVVLTVQTRANQSIVSTADLGEIIGSEAVAGRRRDQLASLLWRSAWPAALPPRDLWLTRTANVHAWVSASAPATSDQLHLCSYEISASYAARRGANLPEFTPPRAESSAIRCELLNG